ncbi:MAG: hypothetical protein H7249_02475 [Chitinophagaceae bacterium]|nr:hypothetical protein [Oligoflexus sp.]
MHTVNADAALIIKKKSLTLGGSVISRDYGTETYTDKPYRASVGIGLLSEKPAFVVSQESTLTVGGTTNAVFTPKRFITFRHELYFTESFSASAEISAKWYPERFVRTANIGATLLLDQFRYQARLYSTHAQSNDLAGYLGLAYQSWALIPEVYGIGGRDAASRPYLFDNTEATFVAGGAQATYRFAKSWAARAGLEQRWESGFRQQTLSAAILWYDR